MTLFCKKLGEGPPLVLVHGWGFNHRVWHDIAPRLAQTRTLYCVDLPGHGLSNSTRATDLKSAVEAILNVVPEKADWLGWSLGGLLSLFAASHPSNPVRRLLLVTTTPKFLNDDSWQHGVEASAMRKLSNDLLINYHDAIRDFLELQARGLQEHDIKIMRESVLSTPASIEGLQDALTWLKQADFRASLAAIKVPSLIISGQRDRLCLAEASEYLYQNLANAELVSYSAAAHMPFVSEREGFLQRTLQFLHQDK